MPSVPPGEVSAWRLLGEASPTSRSFLGSSPEVRLGAIFVAALSCGREVNVHRCQSIAVQGGDEVHAKRQAPLARKSEATRACPRGAAAEHYFSGATVAERRLLAKPVALPAEERTGESPRSSEGRQLGNLLERENDSEILGYD